VKPSGALAPAPIEMLRAIKSQEPAAGTVGDKVLRGDKVTKIETITTAFK